MKIFIILLILFGNIMASNLLDKVQNLVGDEQFNRHNKLIKILFKNEKNFYITANRLDFSSILITLKKNGLLKLTLSKPQDFEVEFVANQDIIKTVSSLNTTFKTMGYYYHFTKRAYFDKYENIFIWRVVFPTKNIIDPLILLKELNTKSCYMVDIRNVSEASWRYVLDTRHISMPQTIKIHKREIISLEKPLKPYFIKIPFSKKMQITSKRLNHWFPYIVFFDEHLNVLKIIKKDKISRRTLNITIPEDSVYVKISDLYTLINIKRGLDLFFK